MRFAVGLLLATVVCGQAIEEDFHVYKDHPRLLLTPQRLKLLKRERQRESPRWQQFETLVAGKAQMAEPTLAYGLYYQIADVEGAVATAAAGARDVRTLALAYDWLPSHRAQIQPRLRAAIPKTEPTTIESARNVAFAAIVLEDHATLERLVKEWWRKRIAPALVTGRRVVTHAEVYPLMELLHAIRDNIGIDLREDARRYFKDFAASRLLSYYPPTYSAPENDFHIPFGPPDLRIAAMSRAAELSLVAYDSNSTETQFVQGWLMIDRFTMRGPLGAVYEFLWANPYQPGLSYEHVPLHYHDKLAGRLFLRSSWDEDALWVGYMDGKAEVLKDGKPQPFQVNKPIPVGTSMILPAKSPMRVEVKADSPPHWYVLGWKPNATVEVEADDEALDERIADPGGILELEFKRKQDITVLLKLYAPPTAAR
jgi:hypothetical protein